MVESVEELRRICQDSVSACLPRKISIYFTKALLHTGITANQVTLLNISLGVIAGTFFAFGYNWYTLIGALLLNLWGIFDYADGEIARYRGSVSITGFFLDRLNHMIVNPYIFASLAFGLFNIFDDVRVFIFGFSASLSMLLIRVINHAVNACVLEARSDQSIVRSLDRKYRVIASERCETEKSKVCFEELQEHLISRLHIFYDVIGFMFCFPGLTCALTIASLMDVSIRFCVMIASFKLNCVYILLILYGILAPFGLIVLVFLTVKLNLSEKVYLNFFQN